MQIIGIYIVGYCIVKVINWTLEKVIYVIKNVNSYYFSYNSCCCYFSTSGLYRSLCLWSLTLLQRLSVWFDSLGFREAVSECQEAYPWNQIDRTMKLRIFWFNNCVTVYVLTVFFLNYIQRYWGNLIKKKKTLGLHIFLSMKTIYNKNIFVQQCT